MKKISILLSLIIFVSIGVQAQNKKVLFIGNSYTYYNNNLGSWVQNIATSMGDSFVYQQVAPGGYQLINHATNPQTLNAIAQGDWDYVVIQEQSQKPSFPPAQVANEVYPYAKILCDSIYAANECTIPMFFMTWGYLNGDQGNCPYYPPLCTYEGMQQRLKESYIEMAEQNNAQVAPVGEVWKVVRQNLDDVSILYNTDGSHPTPLGTYLAACTFYACIYHKSVQNAAVPNGISQTHAQIIKNAVDQVVVTNFETWFIDTVKVRADFFYLIPLKNESVMANFVNYSYGADSCFWDFGDGNVFMQYPDNNGWDDVIHEYASSGNYNVCLTAFAKCQDPHKKCQEFYIDYSSVNNNFVNNIAIMPNPANHTFSLIGIDYTKINSLKIIDISGRVLYLASYLYSNQIDISLLEQGNYFIQIDVMGEIKTLRLIKE